MEENVLSIAKIRKNKMKKINLAMENGIKHGFHSRS